MADTENGAGSPRKRGGQPGNSNALKHGYYSKSFKKAEAADLEEMGQEADLSSEIAMMRVIIRRVFEAADGCMDLESWVGVLGSLGAASTRLAGLLWMQKGCPLLALAALAIAGQPMGRAWLVQVMGWSTVR